jgi:hypothetical protein
MIRYFSETEANKKVDLSLFILKVGKIFKVIFTVETKRGEIAVIAVFSKKQALQVLENLKSLITETAWVNSRSEIVNLRVLPENSLEKIIIQRGEPARKTKKMVDLIIKESCKTMAENN